MEKLNTIQDAIDIIRELVDEVEKDNTLDAWHKYRAMQDVYLEARDYKSNGYLGNPTIYEVIKYDDQAIMYAFKATEKWFDTYETERKGN